ncbi:MAG: Mrp/NBP35 family ATP-binding protein [Tidjanibacter sp.]|nr:Mrp/NBP35 family ATP-binding protein [Tidjanibacter sp.]
MITREEIIEILKGITHPESGQNVVEGGILQEVTVGEEGKIHLTMVFRRRRDPFAKSVAMRSKIAIEAAAEGAEVEILIREGEDAPKPRQHEGMKGVKSIVAVASGKGGVGKSTVTANLAVSLHKLGYKVGVLDADIYGPSQPKLFGVEDYEPWAEQVDGLDYIAPAESNGIKVNSIGFYIGTEDALVWRGPMATNALKQLINQTLWGELDFLLIDMPPGTGDVQISIAENLSLSGAIIVSTPQKVATADVIRGMKMFQAEGIGVPVLGIVENMAYFSPAELPGSRYYIFGKGGAREMAEKEGVDFLGEIPLIQAIAENSDAGTPVALGSTEEEKYYAEICRKVVSKLTK